MNDKYVEVGYYQGDYDRITIDGEWTESELQGDVYDEVDKILNGKNGLAEKYKHRALIDNSLLNCDNMCEYIYEHKDLIEWYNTIVDKHRNDDKKLFGIVYFDEELKKEVEKILKRNLVKID